MVHLERGVSINWASPQASARTGGKRHAGGAHKELTAIILATKSSRGESIVFHYPPEPLRDFSRRHDPTDHESDSDVDELDFPVHHGRPTGDNRSSEHHLPPIMERDASEEPGTDDWLPSWKRILGFESALLADIFTPQESDLKFEMWIDDLVFLGKPAYARPDGSWSVGDVNPTERAATSSSQDKQDWLGSDGATETQEKGRRCHLRSSSSETTAPDSLQENSDPSSPMTSFHLIFALNTKVDQDYATHISQIYQHVINEITAALTQEQDKCGYVWDQCERIQAIKRRGELHRTNIATLWHDILRESDLAEVIQQIYSAISNGEVAHLLVNQRLNVSLSIPQQLTSDVLPSDCDHEHPFLNSALSFGTWTDHADATTLPYYGLILLDEPDNVLAALPPRSSARLKNFVQNVRPFRSFTDLAEIMKISLQDTMSLAKCLLRWGCALPIPPLRPRNTYTVSPTADMSQLAKHSRNFARKFPNVPPLSAMLASLSQQHIPFRNFIPDEDQTTLYLDVLSWMMREKWVMQLRTFVWIKIRAEIKAAVARDQTPEPDEYVESSPDSWQQQQSAIEISEDMFEESIISDPYNATAQERLWLRKLETSHPVADAALFRSVCKYFNGRHAVEKIIVREGTDATALKRVLEIYDEDLIRNLTW